MSDNLVPLFFFMGLTLVFALFFLVLWDLVVDVVAWWRSRNGC